MKTKSRTGRLLAVLLAFVLAVGEFGAAPAYAAVLDDESLILDDDSVMLNDTLTSDDMDVSDTSDIVQNEDPDVILSEDEALTNDNGSLSENDASDEPDEDDITREGDPVTSYDLWVGSTQVTSENMDNIPGIKGGGTASFDPDTKTLTFSGNVTGVTGTSEQLPIGEEPYPCMIYSDIKPLTIAGKASFTDTESLVVIGATENIVIDGDITVKAQKSGSYALGINGDLIVNGTLNVEGDQNGINSEGKVTVSGGNLTATANNGNAIFANGEFTLNGGKVSAKSNQACTILALNKLIMNAGEITAETLAEKPAIEIGRLSSDEKDALKQDLVISEPEGGKLISSYYNSSYMTSIGLETNKPSSKISMKKVKTYDLWVGSTQITDENMDDIPGIKGGGKASYDPATNTLTFTGNVTGVTGTHEISSGSFNLYYQICCYVAGTPLTIKGNAVLHDTDTGRSCGINCEKGLIIEDDLDILCECFALSVKGGSLSVSGKVNAEATGTLPGFGNGTVEFTELIVDGGTLKAKGPGWGLNGGKIDIVSGTVEAESTKKEYAAIKIASYSDKKITLSDDVKIVEPVGGKLSADGWTIVEADGTTVAKKVKIVPAVEVVTVTFKSTYDSTHFPMTCNVRKGDKVTRPFDPYSVNFKFAGWCASDPGYPGEEKDAEPFNFDRPILEDTMVYAKWVGYTYYTVRFELNGHGESWMGARELMLKEGDKVPRPTPPTEVPLEFTGWYIDAGLKQLYDFNLPVKRDFTLYAGWSERSSVISYPVLFDLGVMNDKIPAIPAQGVNEGGKATEPSKPMAPAGSGKVFEGWYSDITLTNRFDFNTPITEPTRVHANWADADGFSVYFSDESYADDALTWNEYKNRFEHVFTGSAIRPAVVVTDAYGNPLKEGTDYTLKYKNNKNVDKKGKPATVTVKGKGNYKKTKKLSFYITAKELNRGDDHGINVEKYIGGTVIVEVNKKPAPVIFYNSKYNTDYRGSHLSEYRYGYKLKSGDYTLKLGNGKKKFGASEKPENLWITITGKGNFTGSIEKIPVELRTKSKMKENPLSVTVKKGTAFTYDGTPKELDATQLTIKGRDGSLLAINSDVTVQYVNNTNAGTARVIVTGINYGYQGLSVTKTFKILPDKKTSKVTASVITPADEIIYDAKGAEPQLLVTADRGGVKSTLVEGTDYKVTYSNNKKVGNKAKYKVTFMGNYKGRKAITGTFTIKKARFGSGITAIGLDKVYSKPGKYTSKIYVYDTENNNRILSSKDYTIVSYVTDGESKDITGDKKYQLASDIVYVNVTIRGRGNYEGLEKTFLKAYCIAKPNGLKDLSKCKIVAKGKTKGIGTCTYNGKEQKPEIDVLIKNGKKWEPVTTSYYLPVYLNNVEKGTATVIVRYNSWGPPNVVGSKTATFKIVQCGMSGFLQSFK